MKQDNNMPQQINVDLSKAEDIVCENCGNYTFQEAVLIKKLSAIMSPTGREALVPVPVFTCNACGHINRRFLPNYMMQQEPQEQPTGPSIKLEN